MEKLLQIHVTWGGMRHHIRDIDVTGYTGPQISEIIVKQHSLVEGCDCTIKDVPSVDDALCNIMEDILKEVK